MRYFLAILILSVVGVVGILGFRGTHFRQPPLYIFPDMEWQLKLRPQKPNGFLPADAVHSCRWPARFPAA